MIKLRHILWYEYSISRLRKSKNLLIGQQGRGWNLLGRKEDENLYKNNILFEGTH